MNILADESVDRQIVEKLRHDGHDVLYVAEMEPGVSDDVVLDRANRQGVSLSLSDKDFGELVYRLGRIHAGVILLRLAGLSPEAKAAIACAVLKNRGTEVQDAFAVVSPGTVRIRRRL